MAEFLTSGDISRLLGHPLHVVTYALERAGIREDGRAGTYRLFRRRRLSEIVQAINAVKSRRGHGKQGTRDE